MKASLYRGQLFSAGGGVAPLHPQGHLALSGVNFVVAIVGSGPSWHLVGRGKEAA